MSGHQFELAVGPAPLATLRFDDAVVRSGDPAMRLTLAVAESLRGAAEQGRDRYQIADRMGALLGRPISVNALNAYASPARETAITAHRFAALAAATGDRRLIELVAEPCGWTVIERRMLGLVRLAMLGEEQRALRRRVASLRRDARQEGLL